MTHGAPPFSLISDDVKLGADVRITGFVNLYGCEIGAGTVIGPFVEIQSGVLVGRRCKIQSHAFICSGVNIGDEVFIGHGVMFINDRNPQATDASGQLKMDGEWQLEQTRVGKGASIGTNATIMCGIQIGDDAVIGAGAVVVKDVPARSVVSGNPARQHNPT